MSVPPEIEASRMSGLISRYTQSKPSGLSGLPVENMARSAARSCVRPGVRPSLAAASMYLAEVPKWVIFSASA